MEIFTLRKRQEWPPDLAAEPDWPDTYRRLAAELDFPINDLTQAIEHVKRLITRIQASAPP